VINNKLIVSDGEKNYFNIFEMERGWKCLADEMKRILAAKLAYAMGAKNPEDIEDLYEALNNIFGTSEEELRKSLDAVRNEIGILSREIDEIRKKRKEYFLLLLESDNEEICLSAWGNVITLIDRGIISVDEVKARKEYFLSLLKSFEGELLEWSVVPELVKIGVLSANKVVKLVDQ